MEPPQSITDILLVPLLLAFLGMFFYILVVSAEKNRGEPVRGRAFAVILLLLAQYTGGTQVWKILNPDLGPFYRAALKETGFRMTLAHYLAAVIPLLCLATVGFLGWRAKAREKANEQNPY